MIISTAVRMALSLVAMGLVALTPCITRAAGPSAAEFVKHPLLSDVSLAPDGKALAGIRFVNGRKNLLVVDLATRKPSIITNFRDGDVVNARWISANRLVFAIADFARGGGDQVGAGLFAIDKDGREFRQLAERSGMTETIGGRLLPPTTQFHSRLSKDGQSTDEILVSVFSVQGQARFASNLYRLDTRTGVSSIATLGGPGHVLHWVTDADSVPRAAASVEESVTRIHYRDDANSPWRVVSEFRLEDGAKSIAPIAFDRSGNLFVSAYQGKDFQAIYRFQPKTGNLDPEPLVAAEGYDITHDPTGGFATAVLDARREKLVGVRLEADRLRTVWFEESLAAMQRDVDSALPDNVNVISGDFSSKTGPLLVHSFSDRDSGRYLLYDPANRKLEQVGVARPWIDPKKMAATRFVRYKARDGLSIPALLTLPAGGAQKNLPLVVMHYGGPWVRAIHWQWDPHVQFLAARGYAVLMPAPRASTGFGFRHFQSGWKQWGLGMQDDITDGVKWLTGEGVVDPKRVCIAGASYGGYAAMIALVNDPDVYRCGVNWVGVTDPEFMYSVTWSDFNRLDAGRYTLPVLLGDPKTHAEQFRRTSTVRRAAEIKQPVLLAYGGRDDRVPIVHGERLRDALAPHNPNVEWIVYSDEGHGWLKEENRIDFWNRVAEFLDRHTAPK